MIIISIFAIIAIVIGIRIFNVTETNESSPSNFTEIAQKEEKVTDSCIDEWEEYSKYVSDKIEEASNMIIEDDTKYVLRKVNGYIDVYYIADDSKEYLYKKTNIPTEYLSKEDIENLENGIEVVGSEEMNKILEDFE